MYLASINMCYLDLLKGKHNFWMAFAGVHWIYHCIIHAKSFYLWDVLTEGQNLVGIQSQVHDLSSRCTTLLIGGLANWQANWSSWNVLQTVLQSETACQTLYPSFSHKSQIFMIVWYLSYLFWIHSIFLFFSH